MMLISETKRNKVNENSKVLMITSDKTRNTNI